MNMWIVTGIVVFKGQKRNERAPWPCIIESDGGLKEDTTTRIPVDIFGDVEVGQHVELHGVLDSHEWQGRRYLDLIIRGRRLSCSGLGPTAAVTDSCFSADSGNAQQRRIPPDSWLTPPASGEVTPADNDDNIPF